jgi:hypothetical protein
VGTSGGLIPTSYTFSRRPVKLVWAYEIETYLEALTFERQVKGWSRPKKEALIHGDWDGIHDIVREERQRRENEKKIGRPERRVERSLRKPKSKDEN